ncbi:MAG: hypothetical protein IJZ50_01580 [Alistipes sp.]|nr:hypothetical protein [Alistipes sp.]
MRKLIILLSAILIASVAIADNPKQTIPIDPIPINPDPLNPNPKPLSLRSDIEASYFNGALTVVFNADLGDADIVVSNLTTGDMWSDSVSGVGTTTLLLSGDGGYYEILIYTDCGEYSGEFEI